MPQGITDNLVDVLKGLDPFEPASYEDLPEPDPALIEVLQGNEYITHEGLIDMAHRDGLMLSYTEPIKLPTHEELESGGESVIFRAIVATRRGVFVAYGDASMSDSMVEAVIRMAETRALSRALRQAVNTGSATAPEMKETTSDIVVDG